MISMVFLSFKYHFVYVIDSLQIMRDTGSANSQIQYSIIDGDDHGNFTIDETTGEIGVVRPLDFELLDPSIM